MTETLTNEAPLLTEDLAFDLGDAAVCEMRTGQCRNEATWLAVMACGCAEALSCDLCKVFMSGILHVARCRVCGATPAVIDWRKI